VQGVTAGFGFSFAIGGNAGALDPGGTTNDFNTSGVNQISYVARDGDTVNTVAQKMADSFNRYADNWRMANPTATSASTIRATVSGATITITGANATGDNFSVTANGYAPTGGGNTNTIGGGLDQLRNVDVGTTNNARAALRDIEGMITTAIDASATFGSAAGRIETQSKFVSGLMHSLKSGIGTLVDADMEEASARLQALQVQQQLGVQSLSIANQAPQSILSLFR
jgi:flagellin